MFDEQQESAADDRDAIQEANTPTAPPDERPSDEPVSAAKGPDAGEGESSRSGEEEEEDSV